MNQQKTILATAYAVNPYKGSEDGMGWNFICQIARNYRVIAITRENNQQQIEQYMQENPQACYQHIEFRYFDLPYWMRFWKKGGRGAMLYYWLWQQGVVSFVRQNKLNFDIVHNLNFHNDWTPSHLWKLDKPFVWGPVGHHPAIPSQYLKPYGTRALLKDRLSWVIKKSCWKALPALQQSRKHAHHVFCMNREACITFPENSTSLMPSVASDDVALNHIPTPADSKFRFISAGRFVPLKGFDLSIRAFAHFLRQLPKSKQEQCELLLVGSGPEDKLLKKLVQKEGIAGNVRFISWLPREELLTLYHQAGAFLFPSHEGAGMVVAEALACSLPVICLQNSGPGEFINPQCGIAVPMQGYQATVKALARAIQQLYCQPEVRQAMAEAARKRYEQHFRWEVRGEQLHRVYQSL